MVSKCSRFFWGWKRKTMAVAIFSMLVYLILMVIATVIATSSKEDCEESQRELDRDLNAPMPTNTTLERIKKALKTKDDSRMKYYFWLWSAVTFCITLSLGLLMLIAGFLRSRLFAKLWCALIGIMTLLNLAPIVYALDTDSPVKNIFLYLTLGIFIHRIIDLIVVIFLIREIIKFPDGPPDPPPPTPPLKSPPRTTPVTSRAGSPPPQPPPPPPPPPPPEAAAAPQHPPDSGSSVTFVPTSSPSGSASPPV